MFETPFQAKEKSGRNGLPGTRNAFRSSALRWMALGSEANVDEEERNEIIVKLANRGICCNVHYKPLPMHTLQESGFC